MKRIVFCFVALFLCIVALSFITLVSGPVDVSIGELLDSRIFWDLRVPRVAAALLAGIALSVSGLSLQTVFQNPLAGPFVLGISSGASFAVALSMLAGFSFGRFGTLTAASVGAFGVTLLILAIASRFRNNTVLLVAGLLIGYFIDACINLLITMSDGESLKVYVSWGMGSFGRLTLGGIWIFASAVLVGLALISASVRYLNGARLGDDFARGLGIRVSLYKKLVLLGASILAAAVTAFCGPVAFLGIAVPHLAYLLFKTSNHRILLPGSALCGVCLALLAGLFPEYPLNAILSLVGVPVILWVLVRSAKRGGL
ncbi:MAG: iron ABC transporter permease [Fibrobacter sp.]|nr:iron ABC transporter permease [Fibrobacter sp.]